MAETLFGDYKVIWKKNLFDSDCLYIAVERQKTYFCHDGFKIKVADESTFVFQNKNIMCGVYDGVVFIDSRDMFYLCVDKNNKCRCVLIKGGANGPD